jgi:hypothetical protein
MPWSKKPLVDTLNPIRIHKTTGDIPHPVRTEDIPIADYKEALRIARPKYDINNNEIPTGNSAAIENYVNEGIGLVDTYCSRWFRDLDDMSRLLDYQNNNMNVITQLGTTLLGIAAANANFVTGYGAATTAFAGVSTNTTRSFFATPTASKVRRHIDTLMQQEAATLKDAAKQAGFKFKDAYTRLEKYADICTHSRAKEVVESALDSTTPVVTSGVLRSIQMTMPVR